MFKTPKPPADAPPTFQSYLRLVDEYHTLSAQVVAHITGTTTVTIIPEGDRSPDHDSPMESPSPVSPKSFPAPKAKATSSSASSTAAAATTAAGEKEEEKEAGLPPIAIVPGWQVTWSDWFASRVDIHDAYSPTDHWQWGATLWRNVVGADVTVAVQAAPPAVQDSPKDKAAGAGAGIGIGTKGDAGALKDGPKGRGGNVGSGGNGNVGSGGVEVRLEDARAVVVMGEREGGVAEGGLRSVGFEIGQWVEVCSSE